MDKLNDKFLAQLPPIIVIPMKEYLDERHPSAKLLRLCNAAEMITRFVLLVAVGVLQRDPERFANAVSKIKDKIDRPTFGSLAEMLRTFTGKKTLAEKTHPIVVDLRELRKPLGVLLDGEKDTIGLIAVRNLVVHSGALQSKQCAQILSDWERRFEKFVERLCFLGAYDLCLLRGEVLHRFRGVSQEPQPLQDQRGLDDEAIRSHKGHMLLVGSGDPINLWPFLDYDRARMRWLGIDERARDESPLIFARADRSRAVLTYA
ncbi:MAG: hypothetical protein U9Q81_17780, partial [Pseudomonadota bacterium]|nr:hypothetical protein [Pseudomonadota bacterium]